MMDKDDYRELEEALDTLDYMQESIEQMDSSVFTEDERQQWTDLVSEIDAFQDRLQKRHARNALAPQDLQHIQHTMDGILGCLESIVEITDGTKNVELGFHKHPNDQAVNIRNSVQQAAEKVDNLDD